MNEKLSSSFIDRLQTSPAVGLARGLKDIGRFRHELVLAAGWHPNAGCTAESICIVNIHKAASTLTPVLIRELLPQLGGRLPVDVEGLVWHYRQDDLSSAIERLADRFYRPEGLIYVPFRKVQWRDKFLANRVIAIVRDPRDVLVSFWYSHAFSHSFPYHPVRARQLLSVRLLARQSSPAEYWRTQLDFVTDSLSSIAKLAEQHSSMTILRYEDMIDNFDVWAGQFLEALGIDRSPQVIRRLRQIADVDSAGPGDRAAHVRQKTAGQYLSEWPAETIEQVNWLLRPLLDRFGYE